MRIGSLICHKSSQQDHSCICSGVSSVRYNYGKRQNKNRNVQSTDQSEISLQNKDPSEKSLQNKDQSEMSLESKDQSEMSLHASVRLFLPNPHEIY